MNTTFSNILSTLPETVDAADRVNILCRVKGIHIDDLARKVGLKSKTIHARMRGVRRSRATAERVALFFGVPPEQIFSDYHRST